jgi:uncharacterized protein YbgA (DUF1722 family)/uncharacterized protein YbbK (DUF523 family)
LEKINNFHELEKINVKVMSEFIKPLVVVSKCIEFDYCRWNGYTISSDLVKIMKHYVDFHPICPEVEIGLGVPRDPVRLVIENEGLKMIQPKTGRDCTNDMITFANKYLKSLDHVDGFMLESQSPSCGLFQTKYYQPAKKGAQENHTGAGLFGRAVLNIYPTKAIETEGRLTNFRIREHWLIKLFTLAEFQNLTGSKSHNALIGFQTKNKLLFMAYNQQIMHEMGRIVANPHKLEFEKLIKDYEQLLNNLLQRPPNYKSHINVLMHSLGFFKKSLSGEEKAFFLDELDKYRTGWIPLFVLQNLLNSWIIRFNDTYLKDQTYFNPYPEELMNFDLKETWRGRSYWQ